MYYVYAIGNLEDLDKCYIGVTNNLLRRWKGHMKSGYTVSQAINENNWVYEENMKVLFTGTSEECFQMENKYRPFPRMGLNVAVGGYGGHTNYQKERNQKISDKLTGRVITWAEKTQETKRKNGTAKGRRNNKAKRWKLVDPTGAEYILHGDLFVFCDKMNLCHNVLRSNKGQKIGPISHKFRDQGNISIRDRRINTIGWCLFELTEKGE